MISSNARRMTQPSASLHDAAAREAYASRFRPIGIQAVAAGTRQASTAFQNKCEEQRAELPGVLRHGFDD
jgi:multidrug efflux pump subunit AcrB